MRFIRCGRRAGRYLQWRAAADAILGSGFCGERVGRGVRLGLLLRRVFPFECPFAFIPSFSLYHVHWWARSGAAGFASQRLVMTGPRTRPISFDHVQMGHADVISVVTVLSQGPVQHGQLPYHEGRPVFGLWQGLL